MKFHVLAFLVLVGTTAVFTADPPEVATGVPAEPSYTRFSLEEDLAKEMSTISPGEMPSDVPSEPPSISISELHANHNMEASPTPVAEPEPTTKQTFIMKITTKSPMMQALMNETMEGHTDGVHDMKPMEPLEPMDKPMEEIVPKPASVKPVEGAHEMKPVMTEKPHEMKPVMENKTMMEEKPMEHHEHDDEHYQNDSPVAEPEPSPEPEPEPEEEKKTPKPVATTQKPQQKEPPSNKDKTGASSQLVSNTTKSHSGNSASSLSPSIILATIIMALISRLGC